MPATRHRQWRKTVGVYLFHDAGFFTRGPPCPFVRRLQQADSHVGPWKLPVLIAVAGLMPFRPYPAGSNAVQV
jgi:hypothetical protein